MIAHHPKTEHALAVTLDEALTPSRIIIRDRADVTNYLLSNPELIPLLGPICAQARQEFGQEADLEMFINHDPEIDDQHLTVLVRIPSYEEDFVGRLDRVTEDFNDELCEAPGYLLLTSDFQPPRDANGI